jgi:hypothetical protein
MRAALVDLRPPAKAWEPRQVTLLELVYALSEVTEDDREVVATALAMLRSGRVRLCGNFRNRPIEDLS